MFTYVPWYLLRIIIIHTLRRLRQQRQYDTRPYNGGTVNTDRYYFFLLLAAVVVRLYAQDRDSRSCSRCVVMYLWSCFNEAFCDCPFGYTAVVAAYFSIYIQFFSGMFFCNQSQPWICTYETNKTTARLIRIIRVIRVHIYIDALLYVYIMIQLHYSSVAASIVGRQVEIQYTTDVRVHVPGTYIPWYILA